jgi:hypothetical protein
VKANPASEPSRVTGRSAEPLLLYERCESPVQAWVRFWFSPSDPFALHLLRVLTGILLLCWLLPVAGEVNTLFGLRGWFDRLAYYEATQGELANNLPKPIGPWSILYPPLGGDGPRIQAIYWASIVVLGLFTLGLATRLTAPLAWVIVVSFTACPAYDDELDPVLHILSLYLAVGYLLLGWRRPLSWLQRVLGPWDTLLFGRLLSKSEPMPSTGATVALRLLQFHVVLMIFTTGLTKLQIGEWWSGVALWYPLHPALTTRNQEARALIADPNSYFMLLNLCTYAVLAWQIGLPLFAWKGGWWRLVLLGGAIAGCVGLWTVYAMPLLAFAWVICCLSLLTDRDWATVGSWLRHFGTLRPLAAWLPDEVDSSWQEPTSRELVSVGRSRREHS